MAATRRREQVDEGSTFAASPAVRVGGGALPAACPRLRPGQPPTAERSRAGNQSALRPSAGADRRRLWAGRDFHSALRLRLLPLGRRQVLARRRLPFPG